ncbi:hypothetical protein MRX96_052370 [Rhipicephalus microplus]
MPFIMAGVMPFGPGANLGAKLAITSLTSPDVNGTSLNRVWYDEITNCLIGACAARSVPGSSMDTCVRKSRAADSKCEPMSKPYGPSKGGKNVWFLVRPKASLKGAENTHRLEQAMLHLAAY